MMSAISLPAAMSSPMVGLSKSISSPWTLGLGIGELVLVNSPLNGDNGAANVPKERLQPHILIDELCVLSKGYVGSSLSEFIIRVDVTINEYIYRDRSRYHIYEQ